MAQPAAVPVQPAFRDDFFYQQRVADLEANNIRLEREQARLDQELRQSQLETERQVIQQQQARLDSERLTLAKQREVLDRYMNDVAEKRRLQQAATSPPGTAQAAVPETAPANPTTKSPEQMTPSTIATTTVAATSNQTKFSTQAVAEALSRIFSY